MQKHRESTFGSLTRAADPCFKRSPRFPRFSTIFYSLLAYTLPRYAVTFYSDWTLTRKWMLTTKNRKSGQSNWAFRNPVTGSSQGTVSVHPHQIRSSCLEEETKLSSRDYLNIALFFILHIPHSWDVWFSVSYPFHNGSRTIPLMLVSRVHTVFFYCFQRPSLYISFPSIVHVNSLSCFLFFQALSISRNEEDRMVRKNWWVESRDEVSSCGQGQQPQRLLEPEGP